MLQERSTRIEFEIIQAEKKLQLDEEKMKLEQLKKEKREHEKYQISTMETLTVKIDGLKNRKREKDFYDADEGEEVDELLKYYVNSRKWLMMGDDPDTNDDNVDDD